MSETNLAVLGNGAGDAEGLKSDTDSGSRVGCLGAALLYGDSRTYGISPYCILEADRLCLTNDLVAVDTRLDGDILAFLDGGNTVFAKNGIDLVGASLVIFKKCHYVFPPYCLRGSMYLAASAKRPYVPIDFSYAVWGSSPFLMKSVILPRDTNSYPIT